MTISSSNKTLVIKHQGRLWDKSIVQELQSLKKQRVTWRKSIAVQRKAMPDIIALRRRAEKASMEELEMARMAEEARQKAEAERSNVQDAVEQGHRLIASEQALSQNRHRSYTLMRQLGIDFDDKYPQSNAGSIGKMEVTSVNARGDMPA
jgi:hypothetical protein